VREKGPVAVADQMVPRLLGDTTRRERPELEDEVRALIEANTAEGIHDALEALAGRPDSTSLLGEIKCPTLILVGREDALTPGSASEAMKARIAGARLEVIDGAGHLSNLERPEAFSMALAAFLDDLA
jgi:pimeloyl-ACP methyl ester carboxylesterase